MPPKKIGTKVSALAKAKSRAKEEDDEFIYEDVSQGYGDATKEEVVDMTEPKPKKTPVKAGTKAEDKMEEILRKFKAQLDEEKKAEKAEREARKKELAEERRKQKEERDKALEGLILHGKRLTAREAENTVRTQVSHQLRQARLSGLQF